jgi:putative ABC transport system substrate-binding protein
VRIAQLGKQYRIAIAAQARSFVADGALVSYGSDNTDGFARTAAYVDKILRGAKPADLPVEQADRFETVVNRGTAKALGLAIPQSVLLRADEVIE